MIQIEGRGQYKNYKEQFYRTKSKNSAEVSAESCCLKFRSTRVLRLLQTFAGAFQKKIRTRAVFKETTTNVKRDRWRNVTAQC